MDDAKDTTDMLSMVSGFSMVSLNGETMDAEAALDAACKDIQTTINELHSLARQMLMADERGDDYSEMSPLYDSILSLLSEGTALFKDFKSICKQMCPPKPRASKKKNAVLEQCGQTPG